MIFKKKQDAAVQQTAAGEAKPAAKGGKAAAFFRKNWKWMVPVVCVAVLGGWFILRPDKAQNANKDINYVQVSPSKRDVSNTLSGTGTLNPANTKAFCDANGIKYIEKNGTTTAEVQMAAEALIAAGVKAVFTPTDNTVMTAELSIYETFTEAGVQHYTGADSFALNGAFVGYGVDYVQLGEATADMVAELLCEGKTTADLPYQTFDNGIVTINTETCEALGLDLDTVKEAFKPYCTEIVEVTTAENFS